MIRFHRIMATCLGIGYIGKGGGTVAAVVTAIAWYLIQVGREIHLGTQLTITLLITALGIWSGNKVEAGWGKDDKKVVIDEMAGMCVSLLLIPMQLKYVITALVLFRFFDIVKPLFIRKTEQLPGGWGVMIDDVVAGIYANILLQLVISYNLF
ncbi:phosphatidylglycerophosphatase A family protein [Chitinophaga defluvii]|uniref:Phosphatidylglycerophosphatase A n=1 Tax=Chitinophaga defluvii TaxID=3163343 RepID=A0ABV2SZV9_9BACT